MIMFRKIILLCIVLLLLTFLASPFAAAAGLTESPALVKELRHWSNPDYTRIAITVDREVHFETHRLPPNADAAVPSRIYLDIAGKLGKGVKDIRIGDRLL